VDLAWGFAYVTYIRWPTRPRSMRSDSLSLPPSPYDVSYCANHEKKVISRFDKCVSDISEAEPQDLSQALTSGTLSFSRLVVPGTPMFPES
jgi:hypothetical protein